ncbi:tRNA adenosine(34) deaminase TadA [Caloranaerobacter azorensis]|uniref:tRNA-specific adenosine deaminase n=2 Tax=Caloranaerobacter azorensis TaxID=116090 RepID=A0A1M5VA57_9FIRM|nr:tRNA adenosine(34) deaminase TadA [Caloranaerobacter azorensis]QIB27835.1 tRNA adenosine(34) deaminase TadA [Caloranaerobacter azorensis]SHH72086.1 tRNA(adenine34) deaminase [Caloranaerobacter azorensis DSM 13643]
MDEYFMRLAIKEAYKAYKIGEVPVGAIVVKDGKVIGRGYNIKETLKDATCHAEIIAIKEASKTLGGWRLLGTTMYVTIEPCPMCAGAIVNSRIERLVIGARDFKMGGCGSVLNIVDNPKLNHRVDIVWGVLDKDCSSIIKEFFKKIRENSKK